LALATQARSFFIGRCEDATHHPMPSTFTGCNGSWIFATSYHFIIPGQDLPALSPARLERNLSEMKFGKQLEEPLGLKTPRGSKRNSFRCSLAKALSPAGA